MLRISDSYENIFDKLYRSGVYHLHANFDWLTTNEKHYAFEVTRRFLDICRVINKYWPNTAKYIVAIHNDVILEQVYAHIFDNSEKTRSLKEAVFASLSYVLNEKKDEPSYFLLQFEQHVAQGKNVQLIYDMLPLNHHTIILFSADFDFLNFYHTTDYYRRTSAPAILFRHIKLIKRATYALCGT